MTKPTPPGIISSLPVILGCALLGAMEARAVSYIVTIEPEGPDVVARSNVDGGFNLTGLTLDPFGSGGTPSRVINRSGAMLQFANQNFAAKFTDTYDGLSALPSHFGTADPTFTSNGSGPSVVSLMFKAVSESYPTGRNKGFPKVVPEVKNVFPIWNGASFASLGNKPGTYTWTLETGLPDQSFTINVVPGPISGAGLPGMIAPPSVGSSRWRVAVANNSAEFFRFWYATGSRLSAG